MSSEIDAFWRYITSGSPMHFSLENPKTKTRVWFRIWPLTKARKANPKAKRPALRERLLAGHPVRARSKGTSLVYLGSLDPETRQLVLADPRLAGLPQTRGLQWLLRQLAAGEWPLQQAQLWHSGYCCRCYRSIGAGGKLPPYPSCSFECVPVPIVPIDVDDEVPASTVVPFRR